MIARSSAHLSAVLAALAAPAGAHAAPLLPDLDQQLPDGLEVAADRSGAIPRFHLGFESAVTNFGRGPLIVDAHRPSTRQRRMVADQLVHQSDGRSRRVRGVGRLQFTVSPDHRHWHYLGFDRYELRRASDYRLVAPDRKTGFCLGDRYFVAALPGSPREPFFTGRCGLGKPNRLRMREGVSPGYGDNYQAVLEGQFVDVTGVAPGRYYLVHRVNADRKLRESDYGNNAASILISLRWPRGRTRRPAIDVLDRCEDTEACPGESPTPAQLERPLFDGAALAAYG